MPRYRDDDWSDDDDYYRVKEIHKRVGRSRSRHGRRSPEEPVINYFENKLYVPGQQQDRRPSRSHSRRRSSSDERSRDRTTEKLLAELALQRRRDHSRDREDDRYDREEDIRRRIELDMRERDLKNKDRRRDLERELDEARRSDDKRRKEIEREIEDEKRKREEDEERFAKEAADRVRSEKEKKLKIAAEMKAEEEAKAKEEERLIALAEQKKKDKEQEAKDLREKVLREVELEKQKEKEKEKKAEQEFEDRIRERAIKAGMDPDRAVRQFRDRSPSEAKSLVPSRHVGTGLRRRVKVRKEHISPEILDDYNLKWNWYDGDRTIILIEDEIDDQFIYELQTVTADRYRSRKLITPGFTKETVTTLMPGGTRDSVRKKGGKYYMVRKRSVSRNRHPSLSDLF